MMKRTLWLFLAAFFVAQYSWAERAPSSTIPVLEQRLKKQPQDRAARERLADLYYQQKNLKKTIEVLAPYSNEIGSEGLILLSEAYIGQKDFLNAIRTLQLYEQKDPNRFRPHFLLGEAYSKNGQKDEAVASYRKAIEFAPKHLPSYQGILQISMDGQDHYESRTILAQMIRLFGPKPDFVSLQCRLLSDGGFLQDAETTCRRAISLSKSTPENHIYLAQSLNNQDRKQAAENVYRNAARQFGNSEFVQFATGEFYFYQKNFPTAVRYLKAAVKIKSDSARSQLALAHSLFEAKQPKEALPHFEAACKLDKTKVAYNELRGAANKLHNSNQSSLGGEYDKKAATCY